MSWSAPEVPPLTITVKQKPVIIMPDGSTAVIKKPFGFASHPAVQQTTKGVKP